MLFNKEFMNKLKDFGLNSYEIKLWIALLSKGTATAGELSDIANVPRSRTYDVLETLEKKGFVLMKLGKPIKYISVPPHDVVERVKKRIQEDAESQSELIDTLSKSPLLRELISLHKDGIHEIDPVELTGILKGRDNLYARLSTMIKDAKKSVKISTTEKGMERKVQALRHAINKALSRRVKIRVLSPTLIDYEGIDSKKSVITTRYCVVDGKKVLIMVPDDTVHEHYDFGILVNDEKFTHGFDALFEDMWKRAEA